MQNSLRSPMFAGTAAVGCAAAIAVTPLVPTVSLPALSSAKSAVILSAISSPITALIDTGALALNYLLTPTYSEDPAVNWPASGIGPEWNALLQEQGDAVGGYFPHITAVGIIPNMIQVPFPVATQLVNNWITNVQLLFQPGGLSTILTNMTARISAVVSSVAQLIPMAIAELGFQMQLVAASVVNVFNNVTTALANGDLQGVWNAAVDGLLSPTGIPGTILNLTIGAGIQTDPNDLGTLTPSIRNFLQTAGQTLAGALATTVAPPVAARATAATSRAAAVKVPAAAPVAAKAATAVAPVVAAVTAADTPAPAAATNGSDSSPKPAAKPAGRRAAAAKAAAG